MAELDGVMAGVVTDQPTGALKALLRAPNVAEATKARIRAELATRHDAKDAARKADQRAPKRPQVTGDRTPTGWRFTIRPEPPSANVIKAWLHHHATRHHYARYRNWLTEAFGAWPLALHAATVHHHWRLPGVARDEDSFGLSLKPVLDAMQAAGTIRDDRMVRLRWTGQRAGGPRARTERALDLIVVPMTLDEWMEAA